MTTATETAAPAQPDEFLTVGEVARRLRVTNMTIYTAIHEGRLEAVRVGRRTFRIPLEAYRAYTSTTKSASETGQLAEPTAA